MKHTPGPWAAVQEDYPHGQPVVHYRGLVALVELSPDRRLSVVTSDARSVHSLEWPWNARLIAAAPDLLKACKEARHELRESAPSAFALPLLEAAIAKAEGR